MEFLTQFTRRDKRPVSIYADSHYQAKTAATLRKITLQDWMAEAVFEKVVREGHSVRKPAPWETGMIVPKKG